MGSERTPELHPIRGSYRKSDFEARLLFPCPSTIQDVWSGVSPSKRSRPAVTPTDREAPSLRSMSALPDLLPPSSWRERAGRLTGQHESPGVAPEAGSTRLSHSEGERMHEANVHHRSNFHTRCDAFLRYAAPRDHQAPIASRRSWMTIPITSGVKPSELQEDRRAITLPHSAYGKTDQRLDEESEILQ